MKKELTLALLFLGLSMLFSSCQKDPEPFLSMGSQTIYEFSAQGGIQTLTFYTNRDWMIVPDLGSSWPSWIDCSPRYGAGSEGPITITLHCFANAESRQRTSTVFILAGKNLEVEYDDDFCVIGSRFELSEFIRIWQEGSE